MTQNQRPVRPGAPNRPPQRPSVPNRPPQSRFMPESGGQRLTQGRPAQPRPQPRPASGGAVHRPSSGSLPFDFLKWVITGAVIIALGVGMQLLGPKLFAGGAAQPVAAVFNEIHGSGPVRLNELMSSNSGTLLDENGMSADWLEVINISNRAVDLEGYSLAKSEHSGNAFTFPKHRLEPGEAVVVFTDSTLRSEKGGEYHAPFRLSSQGGTLMLFSPSGTAVDSVRFPALSSDVSYIRQDETHWAATNLPTPGLSNTQESYQALHEPRTDAGVEITEIVASNTKYAPDAKGQYHDYVELHNTADSAVDLSGWMLSDDAQRTAKWRFPEGFVLQPGEYRIVYASSIAIADETAVCASFGFSPEGESAVLTDAQGRVVDRVDYDLLHDDTAWLKKSDGSWSEGTPSPNAANE